MIDFIARFLNAISPKEYVIIIYLLLIYLSISIYQGRRNHKKRMRQIDLMKYYE